MAFARFMSGPIGRGLRIVAGIALAALGIWIAAGAGAATGAAIGGILLAILGTVVFVAGAANVCFIAPLIRAPFRGKDAK